MSKGMLSIFRKGETAKAEDTASSTPSKLTAALYGQVARPAPPPLSSKRPPIAAEAPRAKLVFAFDATASREVAWETSTALTDALLAALPGRLDVALAVHGGNEVHTFTRFESDAGELRDLAAGVRCRAGHTKLLDLLARVLETEGVDLVLYVGDTFEESPRRARKLAAALAARNTRLIILHDASSNNFGGEEVFAEMARLTSGAVLPFDAAALPRLRELLAAVAVLAVGGMPLLTARKEALPGAHLLLEHLKDKG